MGIIDSRAAYMIRAGILGTTAPVLASLVSWLAPIEAALRIASLLVGIAVGLVTLVTLLAKHRREKHERNRSA